MIWRESLELLICSDFVQDDQRLYHAYRYKKGSLNYENHDFDKYLVIL